MLSNYKNKRENMMEATDNQYIKMTKTPVPKLIISLGIPTTVSMLVTSVYNMADTFFVGKYGTSASGAIGVVFGLMAIIQAIGFMFGQGAGSLCSRALGAKKKDDATMYSSTGFFVSIAMGIFIMVFGLIFINPLMRLLGSTDTILPYARDYAKYILMAAPFMCGSCVLNNVLRYEGMALFSMIGLATGGILNIFGDWILMSRMNMGVEGAGISTAVSQIVSFFILLSMFIRKKTSGKLSIYKVSKNIQNIILICKTGAPALVRQGLTSISTMLLNDYAGNYSDAAVAAMSIVNRICFFTFATALGIGQGFQPVCAFNYGAKEYGRVKKAFLFTFMVGEVFLASVAVVGIFVAEPLISIFRDDAKVIEIGVVALTVQFIGQIFQPLSVCANMMFQSVGKTGIATGLSMLRSGLFFLPILIISTHLFGLKGIQYSQGIADILTMFVALPFVFSFIRELDKKEKLIKK